MYTVRICFKKCSLFPSGWLYTVISRLFTRCYFDLSLLLYSDYNVVVEIPIHNGYR